MSESVKSDGAAAAESSAGPAADPKAGAGDAGFRAGLRNDQEQQHERRMRRAYRLAFTGFLVVSGFYLLSGGLGVILAGVEMAGPPPEAEIPVVPAFARLLGSLVVIGLGVPGIFAFLRRRQERVLPLLKIGGVTVAVLHALLATLSLEAPRGVTVFLLLMAILGMWITLVAFHPRTPAVVKQRAASGA